MRLLILWYRRRQLLSSRGAKSEATAQSTSRYSRYSSPRTQLSRGSSPVTVSRYQIHPRSRSIHPFSVPPSNDAVRSHWIVRRRIIEIQFIAVRIEPDFASSLSSKLTMARPKCLHVNSTYPQFQSSSPLSLSRYSAEVS
jgi:hypothetical protein